MQNKSLGFALVIAVVGLVWYLGYYQKGDAPEIQPEVTEPEVTETLEAGLPPLVNIKGYAFGPDKLRVQKGTTVTWTNEDQAKHTISFDDGTVESQLLAQGESFDYTFDEVGTYAYHCRPHPYMKAEIEVYE